MPEDRPSISDHERRVVKAAQRILITHILTVNAFPSKEEMQRLSREAYSEGYVNAGLCSLIFLLL